MTTQHTPTPWKHIGREIWVQTPEGERLLTRSEEEIPTSWGLNASSDVAIANAAFIVRACNAHEELQAILNQALYYVDACRSGATYSAPEENAEEMAKAIRSKIAEVGGQPKASFCMDLRQRDAAIAKAEGK